MTDISRSARSLTKEQILDWRELLNARYSDLVKTTSNNPAFVSALEDVNALCDMALDSLARSEKANIEVCQHPECIFFGKPHPSFMNAAPRGLPAGLPVVGGGTERSDTPSPAAEAASERFDKKQAHGGMVLVPRDDLSMWASWFEHCSQNDTQAKWEDGTSTPNGGTFECFARDMRAILRTDMEGDPVGGASRPAEPGSTPGALHQHGGRPMTLRECMEAEEPSRVTNTRTAAPQESPLAWLVFVENHPEGFDYIVFPNEIDAEREATNEAQNDPAGKEPEVVPLYRASAFSSTSNVDADAIADKLVEDWIAEDKMPQMAWGFREFAAEAIRRALPLSASSFTREDAAKIIERKANGLRDEYCHGDSGPDGYTWTNKEAEWQVILLDELAEEFRRGS